MNETGTRRGHYGNLASARGATALRETRKPFIVCTSVLIVPCPDCPGQIEYTFWAVWAN